VTTKGDSPLLLHVLHRGELDPLGALLGIAEIELILGHEDGIAIDVVGTLVILTGGLILVGAVAVTKFQRVYEAAVFKTLGASSRTIGAMLMIEYGLLGTLAGAVGSFGALALVWGISRYALDIPWHPALGENVAGTIATSLLITVIGVAASADVLRRKPLATLRAE